MKRFNRDPFHGRMLYSWQSELILHFIPKIFKGYCIKAKSLIRVTRNADIDADALYDEDLDYREFMADLIKSAQETLAGTARNCPREMAIRISIWTASVVEILCKFLDLKATQVFRNEAPLDLSFVFTIQDKLRKNSGLFFHKLVPQKSPAFQEGRSMISQIREGDKLLSFPTNRSVHS